MQLGRLVEKGRERLFHAYGRATSPDIPGFGQQLFHMKHGGTFVAGNAGRNLQVHFQVPGHDADKESGAVSPKDQGLEDLLDGFTKLVGNVLRRQILLIEPIGNQLERNLRRFQ